MTPSAFRNKISQNMFTSNLVIRQTDTNSMDDEYIIGCYIHDILTSFLDCITDLYLSERELSLLKYKIGESSKSLRYIVTPDHFLMIWMDIDNLLDQWEEAAIHYELFEGVVNFKKLRDMV